MIKRDDCIKLIAKHHTDEIVVPLYQAAFEWMAIKSWPLTYYAFGAMGQGSSHGLGFALGLPDRRVLVLDADGSLLMNLGTLVTIAEAAPRNFVHFVFENGTYEANGAHPIPGAGTVSFAAIARGAGISNAFEFSEIDAFEAKLPEILVMEGPVFAALKVTPGETYAYRWDVIHGAESRQSFREAMAREMERAGNGSR